jgi:hypothetical protein
MNQQPPATETRRKKQQAQPKTHAPKGRLSAALRRKKIIKAITEGKTHKQAGIDAGLSQKTAPAQVTAILKEPEVQLTFRTAMERLGLNDEYFARKHAELMNIKRYLPARGTDPGSDAAPGYIEVPDGVALAKGLDIAHKLSGRYVDKHEHEVKRPLQIVIRKFCTPGQPDKEDAQE